ncbi:putative MFS transporter, AGZA family, xanthine/uracil permease [Marininema mesophilum]|uniref:Putative MFS transporter, AGZA family, xanthine/uracil permease n=1 Tax=Marininema mesophilum TaxID=1048340 RepID=A0A1H3BBU1_9BACL|nr:NCS2 family permease [Marininema mesophilum]SDX39158.1 putative MFS transporter, AGZA family, xanthine/uracil permease [Marininema mesophilum]
MLQQLQKWFNPAAEGSSWKKELTAGLTSFFTAAYILVVNPLILRDAGIPLGAGVMATVAVSVFGCLLMAFWARAPIILIPGMGINAFFTFTIVQSLGLSWQAGLGAIVVSGLFFLIAAITPLGEKLSHAVPSSLKHGITAGIGLFLAFIGLQKGALIVPSTKSFVSLGDFTSPVALITLAGLLFTLILYVRNVKGSFLIGILFITLASILTGTHSTGGLNDTNFADYSQVFFAAEYPLASLSFWIAVFSLTMIVVFENMGLLAGMLPNMDRFSSSYRVTAVTSLAAGFFGTSPTIASAESASGIAEGGRTGIPALVAGVLFIGATFSLPVLGMIPNNAAAPVLLIVGALMMQSVAHISFSDFSEGFPAFLIIAGIPLTSSIADGLAFGFIAYPLLKVALGRWKQVPSLVYVIASMFLINLIAMALTSH